MNRRSSLCGGSMLAVVFSLAVAGAAAAQRAAPAEVEEVVVTGSFIAGTPEDAALPVDVIGAQDLQKQGSPTTVNLVKNITAAQSSIGESNRFLGTAAGAATVNLRGFGSARTLVLFNGQRMASSPAAIAIESVDINFIPSIAIGRIEILKDGAAATYGSDAVGGVVNFITRRDLDGWEATANYTGIKGSRGDYDISVARGWKFDAGDALLTATYRRRSELRTTDRDWALRPFAENNFGGWSTASNPGVFQTGTAAQLASGTFSQSFLDNGCTELGGTLVNAAAPASGCRFQFTQYDNLVNDEDHYQVFGQLNFEVAEGWNFHGELLWARHTVDQERVSPAQSTTQFPTPILASGGSPGGGTSPYPAVGLNQQSRFYVPANNPGLLAYLAVPANCAGANAAICANAAANGVITSQTAWRPEGYGGNPLFDHGADEQRRQATAFRVGGSLRGSIFNDIGVSASATYQRNHGEGGAGPDISVTRLQLALRGLGGPGCNPVTGTPGAGACQWFNPFANAYQGNPALGVPNPFYNAAANNDKPELLNWLRQPLVADTYTELAVGELVFNGRLPIELAGGEIGWAVGAQWRYDRLQVNVPDFYDINSAPCVDSQPFGDGLPICSGGTGAHTFYSAVQEIDIDRTVSSLFAEVKIPVFDNFEISGAIRYEEYGGTIGGTTNPKISARWQIVDWLAVRGSAGSTFRAPLQRDVTPGFVRNLAQFNLPGVGSLYRPVLTNNNPNLKPETADTYNLGLIVSAGNFRATVDYFRFKFKDELTNETAASLVSTMFPSATESTWQCSNATFRARFQFADDGNPATNDCRPANLLGVTANLINGPSVDTSGIDFQASYVFPELLWDGDLTLGVEGTYTIEYKRGALITLDGFTIAPALDRAGKSELLSAFYSYPDIRANAYIQFNRNGHNLRWTTRFKAGTDNIVGASILKTKDEVLNDLIYTGTLPWQDVQVTAGIINIFDKDPPFTRSQYNYDYTNAYFLGRTFQLGLKAQF
ncbi:MAG: TonB-dependent receptor [Alphaproteobacteria bacterium]|nr:TonB-dependent receptor [Alphaproteobacteria bacterium]MBU1512598.1 TonB-dependent receptor [Alphaproteobacteria bacterium]MBU2092937.1 TonB-dependent receptor [Alphaproteobacteria bacterium]MBU2150824.1 TonB-dependent receptor [Alphaproteobacteria bacterium]MBU2307964.1 TonB-dependent receptor [Alphaproteobacteria bacterium]